MINLFGLFCPAEGAKAVFRFCKASMVACGPFIFCCSYLKMVKSNVLNYNRLNWPINYRTRTHTQKKYSPVMDCWQDKVEGVFLEGLVGVWVPVSA